jgi:hypothetical protein
MEIPRTILTVASVGCIVDYEHPSAASKKFWATLAEGLKVHTPIK